MPTPRARAISTSAGWSSRAGRDSSFGSRSTNKPRPSRRVMLAGPESGLELKAFAAPRREGIWDEVRTDIAAEAAKHGGTATELDGEFGTELKIVVPVQTPDGKKATQTSRIVGVDGPRWLLRGTFLGKSANEPDPEGVVEQAFRDVIVVRGDGPMAPRDMIAMTMPGAGRAGR